MRKLGEWLPNDPIKVRFFADAFANLRGIVMSVETDHCQVLLYGQELPIRIPIADLIYWDDEDLNAEDAPME